MKTNLIIGTGELGSRHLQGLLKYTKEHQNIFAFDVSDQSLERAKTRANEIEHTHNLIFTKDWSILPKVFDLVIIATNSDIRESIITKLLLKFEIKFLVLEKVLFNNIPAYHNVSKLLDSNNVKTWVNHPRRQYSSYLKLKEKFDHKIISSYQVCGGNWGLACNGLHYIDLFSYLSQSKVIEIDADWVDDNIIKSKRNGFIEFTGTIKGKLENGSIFQINSFGEKSSLGTITIQNAENRYIIQETGNPESFHLELNSEIKWQAIDFSIEFQSSLTTKLASDILTNGSCHLPRYEEAKNNHILFIEALQRKMKEITKKDSTILSIT